MRLKITSFIFLMGFGLINVGCGVDAKDDLPIRPMSSTERIIGVFQSPSGDIISLNDTGFYMIESSTGRRHSGSYYINDLGLLELSRTDGIVRFQIERESSSRTVSRLVGLDRTPFERILSEAQYNNPLFDRIGARYTGIGDHGQGYSLNLELASYRIAEFTRADVPGRSFGAYYINYDPQTDVVVLPDTDDDTVVVVSNQGAIGFTIIRDCQGYISNLIYTVQRREIVLVREGFNSYTDAEVAAFNNSVLGRRFEVNFTDGRPSVSYVFDHPFTLPYIITGNTPLGESPIEVNLSESIRQIVPNYNIPYERRNNYFMAIFSTESRTEIIRLEALYLSDCPIKSFTRIDHDELR